MAHGNFDAFCEDIGKISLADNEDSEELDVQFWERYLNVLKHQSMQQSNVKELDPNCLRGTLVKSFIERLEVQHTEKMKQKIDALAAAKKNLEDFFRIPLSSKWFKVECIKEYEKLSKELKTARGINSDRERSGSTWTVEMLAKYVRREDVELYKLVFPWEFDEEMRKQLPLDLGELVDEINDKIQALSTVMDRPLGTESDTRMVLDAILHTVCFKMCMRVTMRTEQTFKHDLLPTNRCDYVLYFKNLPIGIVEAKRPGSVTDKSVVQLILQLLCVSAENPTRPYFGLLYDVRSHFFAFVHNEKIFLPELVGSAFYYVYDDEFKAEIFVPLLLLTIYKTLKGVCVPTAMCTKGNFM